MMLLVTSALATMPYTGEQQHAMQLFPMDACVVSDNVHACRTQMARAEGPSNKLSLPTIMGTYLMDETLAYFKFQC